MSASVEPTLSSVADRIPPERSPVDGPIAEPAVADGLTPSGAMPGQPGDSDVLRRVGGEQFYWLRHLGLNTFHLTAIVVLEFRQWLAMVFSLTVFLNLGMVFSFSFIAGSRDPALGWYVVPGAAVMALVTLGVMMVAQDLAQQRRSGSILYYASLPISKMAYVLAIVAGNGVAAVPGVVVTVLAGAWLFNLPLTFNPVILLVVPLSAVSLAGLGAAIGLGIKNWRVVGLVSQLTMFFIMFFAPVMIPPDRLPAILRATGWLLPPTYAARAFRVALTPEITPGLLADVAVLAVFAIASLVAVSRTLEWRLD